MLKGLKREARIQEIEDEIKLCKETISDLGDTVIFLRQMRERIKGQMKAFKDCADVYAYIVESDLAELLDSGALNGIGDESIEMTIGTLDRYEEGLEDELCRLKDEADREDRQYLNREYERAVMARY